MGFNPALDTVAGYLDRIRRFLHETDKDASFWTNDFLLRLFNSNYRRRWNQCVMAFEGYGVKVATRDIVADQSRYAWPPGFERLIKMELVRTDGRTVPIQRYERHESINYFPNTGGDNYYPTYRPIGSSFVLEPGPNETVSGGLRMEYQSLPAELCADGDQLHPDFPRSFDELIVLDTVVAALDSEDLLENGVAKSALRLRSEFEFDFERFIDGRMVSRNQVDPFWSGYPDA
jgi:hypothetical protein